MVNSNARPAGSPTIKLLQFDAGPPLPFPALTMEQIPLRVMEGIVTPFTTASGALRRKLAHPMPYQPLLHCVNVQAYGAERGAAEAEETANRIAVERRMFDIKQTALLLIQVSWD